MISPINPRWTPSGLTAIKVRSWFVPGRPYTGGSAAVAAASHRAVVVEAEEELAPARTAAATPAAANSVALISLELEAAAIGVADAYKQYTHRRRVSEKKEFK